MKREFPELEQTKTILSYNSGREELLNSLRTSYARVSFQNLIHYLHKSISALTVFYLILYRNIVRRFV